MTFGKGNHKVLFVVILVENLEGGIMDEGGQKMQASSVKIRVLRMKGTAWWL